MTSKEASEIIQKHRDVINNTYPDSLMAINNTEALEIAIKVLKQQDKDRWIPVSEKLPDANKDVYVTFCEYMEYSKKYRHSTCKAIYVPEHTIKSEDLWSYCDNDDLEIYDEKDDVYYAKDGWYEVVENWDDYSNVAINAEVTAWKELPEKYMTDEI